MSETKLPSWAMDMEDVDRTLKCKHCGSRVTVITPIGVLCENVSYFCDEAMSKGHEIVVQ